jgi:predicted nuclease of predicted toxin-antitoxin system
MSQIKYLLDENLSPRLRKALKKHSPDMVVWRIGDEGAPMLGTLDPEILVWCEENMFIINT